MDSNNIGTNSGGTLLHNLMSEYVTEQAIICPYADDKDVVDNKAVKTCGLIRIPFMEGDVVSPEKNVKNKHGKVIAARDVLLKQKNYMTFYRREFILNDDDTVTPTYNGHYGDWVDTELLIQNIKRGMGVINKARRKYAIQQEQQVKIESEAKNPVEHDMIDAENVDDVVEF